MGIGLPSLAPLPRAVPRNDAPLAVPTGPALAAVRESWTLAAAYGSKTSSMVCAVSTRST